MNTYIKSFSLVLKRKKSLVSFINSSMIPSSVKLAALIFDVNVTDKITQVIFVK